MSDFKSWVGRQVRATGVMEGWPLTGLASVIDEVTGFGAVTEEGVIHPCAHWLYFVPSAPGSKLGADGHPMRGDFIPPLPQVSRMWAKSAMEYAGPIRVGDQVEKISTLASIEQKQGKTGSLIFVEIDHEYRCDGSLVRGERQTLVYHDHRGYTDDVFTARANQSHDWSQEMRFDAVDLFRYSAVTFNGHRIHYDADYSRTVEGYPEIVVQGQLIATAILSQALSRVGVGSCRQFTFKAVKPIFCDQRFYVEGLVDSNGNATAWARQEDGRLNMTAEILL
ncbi:FAS1-like dehydratase domain-containing protein [Castellaniella sp.]|uniref:FAS1-like dehydratase domain-containing protein n=1 Tax=Castellaniella sp. TaxID=1955812 RepID=UPI003A903CFB